MPKASDREIEESLDREGAILDDEDHALIDHILNDDGLPPQGLHQQGWKDPLDAEEDY